MEFSIVLLTYVLIIIFDFLPLLKRNNKKAIYIYSVIMFFTFGILVFYSLSVKKISLMMFMKDIINNIF
jgi:hypothetical protein